MAVEDSGIEKRGYKVEIVSADHQNKPDVGSAIARQWYDADKVDVIVDTPNSGVATRGQPDHEGKGQGVRQFRRRVVDLTGKACSPEHRALDVRHVDARQRHRQRDRQDGRDTWFFITADYAFGHALERDTSAVGHQERGQGAWAASRCRSTTRTSARSCCRRRHRRRRSWASPTPAATPTNSIKQAAEFGIVKGGQSLAGLLVFLTDVHALGLQTAQGLIVTEHVLLGHERPDARVRQALRAATRASIRRWCTRASTASVLHYLKAVEALKSDDGTKVVAKMKEMPTDDRCSARARSASTAARSIRRTLSK
jgi:branched-chain amino acid transport system substrate-binding protein